MVSALKNGRSGIDNEERRQQFVITIVGQSPGIAPLVFRKELCLELFIDNRRPCSVRKVVQARDQVIPANTCSIFRTRTESDLLERPAEIASPHESNFRIESRSDEKMFRGESVTIADVVEAPSIARFSACFARRIRAGVVQVRSDIFEQEQICIGAVCGVRLVSGEGRRPQCRNHSDIAAAQDVAFDPDRRKIGRNGICRRLVVGLDIQNTQLILANASCEACARIHGHREAIVQPDAPAEEDNGHVARIGVLAEVGSTEREDRLAL